MRLIATRDDTGRLLVKRPFEVDARLPRWWSLRDTAALLRFLLR